MPQVVVRRRQALWHSCATVETDCPLGEAAGRSVEAGGADSRITAAQRVINALGGIHLNGLIGGSPDAGAPLLLVALPRKRETAGFLTLSDIPADSRACKPAKPLRNPHGGPQGQGSPAKWIPPNALITHFTSCATC